MKFPSILKIPEHKRFKHHYRYYDPVKEDIENRTARIKSELEMKKKADSDISGYRSKISGSFSQKSYYKESKSGMLRFTLIVVLFFGTIGYLYFGNIAVYILIGLITLIYFLRKRQIL